MPDTPMAAPDDPSIPSSEVVYRRVPRTPSLIVTDALTGLERPSTGAFKPDADGISVYRNALLVGLGQTVEALRRSADDVIYGVEVGDVRAAVLGVVDDVWPRDVPDPEHPRNGAHALLQAAPDLSRKDWKRKQDALARAPSLRRVVG